MTLRTPTARQLFPLGYRGHKRHDHADFNSCMSPFLFFYLSSIHMWRRLNACAFLSLMTTLPVTKPYATHSPSLEQRDTVTAEDLAEYRLPPALPLSLAGTNYMGPATPRRPPSPPPSPVHPSPSFRARSLPPSHATTETHENSELDDDDNQDDTMDVEAGASPMESNDPFNKATLSPFADMLRRSGVISLGSEVPM